MAVQLQTSLHRIFALGGSRRAGSGTGSGFIGEQAALYAIHKDCAEATGYGLPHAKRFGEDPDKDGRKLRQVDQDDKYGQQEKANRHDRNHDIQNLYGGIFLEYDDCSQNHKDNGRENRRNLECICKRRAHGVTDDLADAAPADKAGDGKQAGKDRTFAVTVICGKSI